MANELIDLATMRELRALSASGMPDQATFERAGTPISNGRGQSIAGTPTTFTSPCRILDGVGDDETSDELRRVQASCRLFCPITADIRLTDVVISQRRNDVEAASRWAVVYAPPPTSYQADRIVGLKRLA